MADDAKVERDTSRTLLILVFRRLCWVGKENRIVKTLREVQQLYDESVEKNIILCGKKGVDPYSGAHLEWQNALKDLLDKGRLRQKRNWRH